MLFAYGLYSKKRKQASRGAYLLEKFSFLLTIVNTLKSTPDVITYLSLFLLMIT